MTPRPTAKVEQPALDDEGPERPASTRDSCHYSFLVLVYT
jgi:hypothetical protein